MESAAMDRKQILHRQTKNLCIIGYFIHRVCICKGVWNNVLNDYFNGHMHDNSFLFLWNKIKKWFF